LARKPYHTLVYMVSHESRVIYFVGFEYQWLYPTGLFRREF
jgi:hypothetical protein